MKNQKILCYLKSCVEKYLEMKINILKVLKSCIKK